MVSRVRIADVVEYMLIRKALESGPSASSWRAIRPA